MPAVGRSIQDHDAARAAAVDIVRTLASQGHTAYFAGGCVRDELLGLAPMDYDVATDATPDRICTLFPRTAEVGASFGVVLVKMGSQAVEVATFRADGPYSDRRRPDSITFSNPEQDAQRRDYTVNALFLDPLHPQPRVIDFVNGLADIHSRTLRAVGNPQLRLAEDHLRALRAARLAAKLGLTIDPATANAIRADAFQLEGVSRERIGEEVRRMAEHPSRAAAAALVHDLGMEGPVFRLYAAGRPRTWGVLQLLPPEATLAPALSGWCLDMGHDATDARTVAQTLRRSLTLSNEIRDGVVFILGNLPRLRTEWSTLPVAAQKRLAANDLFADCLMVLRALSPDDAAGVEARVSSLSSLHGGLSPEPLITGEDLIAMGLPPGPAFKRVLDGVYDAQLEGRATNRKQALELARAQGV